MLNDKSLNPFKLSLPELLKGFHQCCEAVLEIKNLKETDKVYWENQLNMAQKAISAISQKI